MVLSSHDSSRIYLGVANASPTIIYFNIDNAMEGGIKKINSVSK